MGVAVVWNHWFWVTVTAAVGEGLLEFLELLGLLELLERVYQAKKLYVASEPKPSRNPH